MARQLLASDYNKQSFYISDGDKFHIQTVSDVGPVLEHTARLRAIRHTTSPGGDYHLASIPIVVLNAWAQNRGVTFSEVMSDNALLNEFLQDPENEYFRVHKGKL